MTLTAAQSRFSSTVLSLCLVSASLLALAGCAPLIVGGTAATTAVVAADRRTAGEQLDDKSIQMKISAELADKLGNRGRYNIESYAGRVLLLGDVPTEADKQQAEQFASQVERVRQVVNQMRVGDITPLSVRTNDSWLTTKVTTTLINTQGVPTRTITVTTERGIVYLMGKVTQTEAQLAARAASSVAGINKVVTLFQIVSPDSLTDGSTAPATPAESDTASPSPAPASGVEVMPIQ